jgi:peptidoglycan/LPS O-acetylase OafA/YrhL
MAKLPRIPIVNVGLILAGIVVSLILAEASWRLIESPAQGLRKKLSTKKRNTSRPLPDEEKLVVELAEESRTFSVPPAAAGDQ